jgi:hypothetical protein
MFAPPYLYVISDSILALFAIISIDMHSEIHPQLFPDRRTPKVRNYLSA